MIHELKTWPEYYTHLVTGRKTFELRRNDRPFREGDTLHLREYEPVEMRYTGREMHRVVTYMLATDMHSDFVVMALAPQQAVPAIGKSEDVLPAIGSAPETSSSSPLEGLIARWREKAAACDREMPITLRGVIRTLTNCATELAEVRQSLTDARSTLQAERDEYKKKYDDLARSVGTQLPEAQQHAAIREKA